jgi:acetyltransferase
LGDADEKRYGLALESALASDSADAIVVVLTPQAMTPQDKVAEAVVQASSRSSGKPILAVFMGLDDRSSAIQALRKNNVPNYLYPEQAAAVLDAMCEYAETHGRTQDEAPRFLDVDDEPARQVIAAVRKEGRVNLTTEESMKLASTHRIPVPTAAVATSREEAAQLADRIGYPIVLKVVSSEIIHKTDLGGVVLDIKNREELERNYDLVIQRMRVAMPEASIRGVLVQKMYPSAREMIIGAIRDPQFGPLLMFGLGGIYVNFLRDVSYSLSPLTEREAMRMIQETKAYALLRGVRGQPPSDIESIVDVMLRLSHLMTHLKEVVEMEINPLFAYEKGCLAVDVRVTISREEMKGVED